MKTLILLSALALLASLAQADPLPEATEEPVNEEQADVENQDVSISFGDSVGSALQDAGKGPSICSCRKACKYYERIRGVCIRSGRRFKFCCH